MLIVFQLRFSSSNCSVHSSLISYLDVFYFSEVSCIHICCVLCSLIVLICVLQEYGILFIKVKYFGKSP